MAEVRDVVLVTAELATVLVTGYVLWRVLAGPDAGVQVRMRLARVVESRCQHNAERWASLADEAAKVYERARGSVSA